MAENIIPLLAPFFVLGIVVEALVARRRGASVYHAHTLVSDVGTGIGSQIAEAFFKVAAVLAYAWIYEHWRLVEFAPGSPWPWLIALFGIDFAFYWWHRTSHEVNVMWGVHVVHHHSEDFNLSVALRQPAFELFTAFVFYAPLALLGVPAHVWVTMYALNLFYQFWTHTELVDRLGPLERVLNTPSHHRVHHGVNPEYLDKNYGGIFILWDKLFGTFAAEHAPVVFGVTKPLRSFNPLWANIEYYAQVFRSARRFPRIADRLRVWWAHPGWQPETLGPAPAPTAVDRAHFTKYDPGAPPAVVRYVSVHFWIAAAASGAVLATLPAAGLLHMIVPGLVVIATLVALAGMVEMRDWAPTLDTARQIATVGLVAWYAHQHLAPNIGIALAAALAVVFAALRVWLRPKAALAV